MKIAQSIHNRLYVCKILKKMYLIEANKIQFRNGVRTLFFNSLIFKDFVFII